VAANRAARAATTSISAQSVGLESKKTSGRGGVFFLDFPLYRTNQAQWCAHVVNTSLKEGILMTDLEETSSRNGKIWLSFCLCLPSLLGFLAFLFSFPINRQISFWPHEAIAEIFVKWFLFITPLTTVIAVITLIKQRQANEMIFRVKLLSWVAVVVSLIVNAIVLLGMSG
jgi:hypothetical protein